jgi:hypothetical protein
MGASHAWPALRQPPHLVLETSEPFPYPRLQLAARALSNDSIPAQGPPLSAFHTKKLKFMEIDEKHQEILERTQPLSLVWFCLAATGSGVVKPTIGIKPTTVGKTVSGRALPCHQQLSPAWDRCTLGPRIWQTRGGAATWGPALRGLSTAALLNLATSHCSPAELLDTITEANRTHLVVFGMLNRTFNPSLAAMHRNLNVPSLLHHHHLWTKSRLQLDPMLLMQRLQPVP